MSSFTLGAARELDSNGHVRGHVVNDPTVLEFCPGPNGPLLMQALHRGNIMDVTCKFFANRRDGQEEQTMETSNKDMRIRSIKLETKDTDKSKVRLELISTNLEFGYMGEDGNTQCNLEFGRLQS